MSLVDLPIELILAILDHVHSRHLQRTVLSLHQIVPTKHIPVSDYIFKHVRLYSTRAIVKFILHIQHSPEDAARVRELSIESWDADAQVINNLLALIPETFTISALLLCVGPTNFAPHQLESLLSQPILGLRRLAICFNPYFEEKTNYYSFHAGTYYDSSLTALARWPPNSIPALTITEIPKKGGHSFSQPSVFFDLDPVTTLGNSAAAYSLTSLKLGLPSKDVMRHLCGGARPFPSIGLLDLSTCDVRMAHLETILIRFADLQHLIVDGCNLFQRGMEANPNAWRTLGEKCALYGVKKVKDREASLRQGGAPTTPVSDMDSSKRSGRKGLASATITLRGSRSSRSGNGPPEFYILPPAPTLTSFSTTVLTPLDPSIARQSFEQGWLVGIKQLNTIRKRLRGFWQKGKRVLEFFDDDESEESGFKGLLEVDPGDDEAFNLLSDVETEGTEFCPVPVLCLASDSPLRFHATGCGHRLNWRVWRNAPDE